MRRPTPAPAERGVAPHQLSEQLRERNAARDRPAVPAVGDRERIARLEGEAGTNRDPLLAAAQVHRPLDLAMSLEGNAALLKLPDRRDRAVGLRWIHGQLKPFPLSRWRSAKTFLRATFAET